MPDAPLRSRTVENAETARPPPIANQWDCCPRQRLVRPSILRHGGLFQRQRHLQDLLLAEIQGVQVPLARHGVPDDGNADADDRQGVPYLRDHLVAVHTGAGKRRLRDSHVVARAVRRRGSGPDGAKAGHPDRSVHGRGACCIHRRLHSHGHHYVDGISYLFPWSRGRSSHSLCRRVRRSCHSSSGRTT